MTTADILGFVGVTLLLGAYLLQLRGRLSAEGSTYTSLNAVGAGLACGSAWLSHNWPFVILEGVWAIISAVALVRILLARRP